MSTIFERMARQFKGATMEVFTQIDGAQAIVKYPKGVYKQVQLYRRKDRVYIKHAQGFVEVRYKWDGAIVTGHPDIKLLEHDQVDGIVFVKDVGGDSMRWKS